MHTQTRHGTDFFARPTCDVAQALLGQKLVYKNRCGLITETEAYIGQSDPACHAAKGKTKRTAIMYDAPGMVYVFLIYGVHHCLNFVTERKGFPAAVLIRGLMITDKKGAALHLDGPGKLTRHLGIDRTDNGYNSTTGQQLYVAPTGLDPGFETTPRIGISKGQDKLWRFVVCPDSMGAIKQGLSKCR